MKGLIACLFFIASWFILLPLFGMSHTAIVFIWLFGGPIAFIIDVKHFNFSKLNDEEFNGMLNPKFLKWALFVFYLAIGLIRLFCIIVYEIIRLIAKIFGVDLDKEEEEEENEDEV
jgi:hypothetical protein